MTGGKRKTGDPPPGVSCPRRPTYTIYASTLSIVHDRWNILRGPRGSSKVLVVVLVTTLREKCGLAVSTVRVRASALGCAPCRITPCFQPLSLGHQPFYHSISKSRSGRFCNRFLLVIVYFPLLGHGRVDALLMISCAYSNFL